MRSFARRFIASVTLLALIVVAAPGITQAATTKTDVKAASTAKDQKDSTAPDPVAGTITKTYNAASTVQVGMIVQIDDKDPTSVLVSTSKDAKRMYGVVIPPGDSPIVLSAKNPKLQQVLVTNGGRQSMLVSNQAGPVKAGDYLTISAIDGVAMKAGLDSTEVIGKASGVFSGNANVVGAVKLKDSLGKESSVTIGRIAVDINVTRNPHNQETVDYVPTFLSKLAIGIADKPVNAARVYLSLTLLLIAGVLSFNVLYSGIRGGMIAVGRNPLSKKSIIKSLIETVFAGLIILVVGVFGVYLILKL